MSLIFNNLLIKANDPFLYITLIVGFSFICWRDCYGGPKDHEGNALHTCLHLHDILLDDMTLYHIPFFALASSCLLH